MGKPNYLEALLAMKQAHPDITRAELAARAGVSTQAAYKWFRTGGVEEENLRVIAEAYDADYDELRLYRRYVPLGTRNVRRGPAVVRQIPLLDWTLRDDWRSIVAEPNAPDLSEMIPSTKKVSPDAFALVVRDDSMESTGGMSFPAGSMIIVDPAEEPRHGSNVVARVNANEELTFKQLVFDGGRRYLKPLNPRYPVIEADQQTEIVGVVVQMVLDVEP